MSDGRVRGLQSESMGNGATPAGRGFGDGKGMATTLAEPGSRGGAQSSPGTVESFATLINKKVLLPSQRTNYIAVDTYFLVQRMRPIVSLIHVDEEWYARQNPDVMEAVGSKQIASGKEHYVLSGYYEHRMPYRIDVQEEWYLEQYADVRDAVAAGSFASAQAHFEEVGYREGRFPFPHFRLRLAGAQP